MYREQTTTFLTGLVLALSASSQLVDDSGDVFGKGGKTGEVFDVGLSVVTVKADEGGVRKPLCLLLERASDTPSCSDAIGSLLRRNCIPPQQSIRICNPTASTTATPPIGRSPCLYGRDFFIGSANSHLGSTYNGWIDVYSFGTGNNPIYISANNSDYSATVDWGVNAISNGGNVPNQWRTLSHSEWGYIFSGRPYATLKYGTGSVNGVHGLIVLPDRWITPDGCSFHSGMNGWTNNNYNLLQWDSMEAAGAVFLPAAGRRHNSSGNGVDGINNSGCYWTSSRIDLGGAFAIMFSANSLNRSVGHHSSYGLSVRLVHNSN